MATLEILDSTSLRAARPAATPKSPWAIVLAGGAGQRLRSLTRYVCGDDRPKQFAPLLGPRSLLRHALDRIGLGIPLTRTVLVTHARDAAYLAREFGEGQRPECLVQPYDRGTAAAILWATHVIRRRECDATVVVFPSDHYVEEEHVFMGHVLDVAALVRRRESLVLFGAPATSPDTQYGWIAAGEPIAMVRSGPICRVRRFWEKPSLDVARDCLEAGGWWNTFILASTVATLATVGATTLPELSSRLAQCASVDGTAEQGWAIRQAFTLAPAASFSLDVLERNPASLAVSPLRSAVHWTDLGTPERVVASLQRAGLRPRWLESFGEVPVTGVCGKP
jgi:mannose-1-phosphate guanylyltransferase